MATLQIPEKSLVFLHDIDQRKSSNSKPPSQILRLEAVEEITKDILRSLRSNEQVKLCFGARPTLQLNKRDFDLYSRSDKFPSDVFTRSSDSSGPLYFTGKSQFTLEAKRAKDDGARTDDALANLENTLKSIQEQKLSSAANIVRSKEDYKHLNRNEHKPSPLLGKDHLLGGVSKSMPSSPFLSASYSPRHGPTSDPLSAGLSPKDKLRLAAIKLPLLHLLAARPMTIAALAEKINASKKNCEQVLDKIAKDAKGSANKKELKEKSYKELDVWKFPYQSQEERQAAIENAIHALDRLRVDKHDSLWQLFLPKEDRGKGKTLSRLNFDKPAPVPTSARVSVEKDTKAEESDAGKDRPKKAIKQTAKTDISPQKKVGEKKPLVKVNETKDVKTKVNPSKAVPQHGKDFKSSERIINSDDEAEAANSVVVKSSSVAGKKLPSLNSPKPSLNSPKRPVSPLPKKQVHKSSLSNSSTSSSDSRKPARTEEILKKDRDLLTKSQQPRVKNESNAPKASPRTRNGSSPQKPSPLGSSPPTNSTDVENSSSSKSSVRSSAPSSPPSVKEALKKKVADPKPAVPPSERKPDIDRGRSPVKRKAESSESQPPPKRQQVNGMQPKKPERPSTANEAKPPLKRIASGAEMSSVADKAEDTRASTIKDAVDFRRYYRKYKALYERIEEAGEDKSPAEDVEHLLKLHNQLSEMKASIWDNWLKIDSGTSMAAVAAA